MFYENFINLCLKVGKSPSFVVTEIGLNKSAVTSWKRGSNPTNSTSVKIAAYFGISVDELIGIKITAPALGVASDEANLVAKAYDLADDKSRAMVRLALGLDVAGPQKSGASNEAM